jgi:hypothetical protein
MQVPHVHMCIYTHTHTHIYIDTCTHIHIHVESYTHIHIEPYIHTHSHTYTHTHTLIYTHRYSGFMCNYYTHCQFLTNIDTIHYTQTSFCTVHLYYSYNEPTIAQLIKNKEQYNKLLINCAIVGSLYKLHTNLTMLKCWIHMCKYKGPRMY